MRIWYKGVKISTTHMVRGFVVSVWRRSGRLSMKDFDNIEEAKDWIDKIKRS